MDRNAEDELWSLKELNRHVTALITDREGRGLCSIYLEYIRDSIQEEIKILQTAYCTYRLPNGKCGIDTVSDCNSDPSNCRAW